MSTDQQENAASIECAPNGPYIDVTWGKETSKKHYALCRCGKSKNIPFCDGAHRQSNFQDDHN